MLERSSVSCTTGTRLVCKHRDLQGACIMGIDEAGRGPVLGPMVYGAVYSPASLDLSSRAFADSKTLTATQRESLLSSICEDPQLGFVAEILSAEYISRLMLAVHRTSLNEIAAESTFKLIQTALDQGIQLQHVYIDTVGDPDRYQARLSRQFPSLTFTVCPKADALFPVVSAASIVAKVTRDTALSVLVQDCGLPADTAVGTGYPGDPDTKAWLRGALHRVYGLQPAHMVRFSWETCNTLMAQGSCVKLEFEADADDEQSSQGGPKQQRLTFACKRPADVVESSGLGRHAYFRARKLQRLTSVF